MRLYSDLSHLYTLLTPRSEYEEEAGVYQALLRMMDRPAHLSRRPRRLP